jgi:small-conductance mechanosensitive channel
MSEMFNAYSIKLINSLFLTLFFIASYIAIQVAILRKIKNKKTLNLVNVRLRYFLIAIFMICFIKIWVDGFIQILAFIGFLSAAITITQKDNLMNLIGWLIINWRGLFHEEDYIKISNYIGYVKSIGILYFTLIEANNDFPGASTGRVIKLPNGMVARNPVTNFSQENYVETTVSFVFRPIATFEMFELLFLILMHELIQYLKLQNSLALHPKEFDDVETYEPKYLVKIRQEKPAGFEFVLMFYTKYQDKADIQFKINKAIVAFIRNNPELVMAFD